MRAASALRLIGVVGRSVLWRALEVYDTDRLDFAEVCLLAAAGATGVGAVRTVDRAADRVDGVTRIEPCARSPAVGHLQPHSLPQGLPLRPTWLIPGVTEVLVRPKIDSQLSLRGRTSRPGTLTAVGR